MVQTVTLKVACSLMVVISSLGMTTAAYAQKSDVFNRSTGGVSRSTNPIPVSGNAALGNNSPVARWFDSIDTDVITHSPTPTENGLLGRSFRGDAKRTAEWTAVAGKTARQYRELARILRSMNVPPGLGEVQDEFVQYKNLTADWYDDSAAWFEDWIRPRHPASTREELQEQLDEMHQRCEALIKQNNTSLQVMDKQLRDQFNVRPRDDKLMQYVAKRPVNN